MKRIVLLLIIALAVVTTSAQGTFYKQEGLSFYGGAGYTFRSTGGLSIVAGTAYGPHDLQLSYTLGQSKSDPIHWYDDNGIWQATTKYKQNTFGVRYGYRLALAGQLVVTPQLGYSLNTQTSSLEEGIKVYGDKAKASTLTIGARLTYEPLQHCVVFLSPEYGIRLSQDTYYKHTTDISNCKADGLAVTAGLMFCF